jgi:hypothetical protein
MEPREIISSHLTLCDEVYQLLLEENTWLKTEKCPPTMDFLNRKKAILPKLDESLNLFKKLKPELFSPFDDTKQLIKDSHSKLLQIFYVDRENEDLLIKLNQPHDRQVFNRFTTPPEEIDEIHEPPSKQSDQDIEEKESGDLGSKR